MNSRFLCIHGHFYQPPRENAWLEAVEMQESAYPAHDWNERITRECYAMNARARLLNEHGRIEGIASNYERMSFNFGPTLLAWMKESAPRVHEQVLESDRRSAERFGGHGSAMAQAYNHAILPLCNERDRRTQIHWGLRDFEHRFGRKAEGLWLPETAADTPTLEALADAGVTFAVLAPRQCAAVRPIGSTEWHEVNDRVDPTRAYRCDLPSGKALALFFYDGPVSQAVAFEGLLNDGHRFADRLRSGFDSSRTHAQLMHIATDGESYGHHHPHGEMALAAALREIEADPSIEVTNYGHYLERHPPELEARIHEGSSWSCVHGVERWRIDCGCNSGRAGFHQRWRAPLRSAFDWLRDSVAPHFERTGATLLKDPWAARDAYVEVVLDRSPESIERFMGAHAARPLSEAETTTVLELMELQRHAMLMYTSCAWFFDDIAGIETVQVIQYAARVIQLARSAFGTDLEPEFLERLAKAPGNTRERPDGRAVFEQCVRPAMLDLERVAAHHAVNRLFDGQSNRAYSFDILGDEWPRLTSGRARLVVGNALFRSRIDGEAARLSFCALHLGDHTVSCGVRPFAGEQAFGEVKAEVEAAFHRADFAAIIAVMQQSFGGSPYSIGSLFRDEQHAVVRRILAPVLEHVDHSYRQIYEQHAPLAHFLRSLSLTVPRRIQLIGTFVLSQSVRRLLDEPTPDLVRATELLDEATRAGIELDAPTIDSTVRGAFERAIARDESPDAPAESATSMLALVRFALSLPFTVDLWTLQEHFVTHLRPRLESLRNRSDEDGVRDAALLRELGESLEVQV